MNKVDQLKAVRRALVKYENVYSKYQGKNLNRYKNTPEIDAYLAWEEKEQPPFEFMGILSRVLIRDYQNVDTTPVKERIIELENIIHELDLFDNGDADQYLAIKQQLKTLSEQQRSICRKYPSIPTYFLDDFCALK